MESRVVSNGSELLRMLEPAVRPGGLAGPVVKGPPAGPIETRDFDSILAEVRQADNNQGGGEGDQAVVETGRVVERAMISQLSQVDRIENSSLIGLFGGSGAAGKARGSTSSNGES